MDDPKSLPFLTRKMLNFEHGTKFELGLNIWACGGETVLISGLTKDGPFSFKVIGPSNCGPSNKLFNISDIPVYLSIIVITGNIDRGKVYANLYLNVNSTKVYSFISGYVTSTVGLTWPYGRGEDPKSGMGVFESVTGTNPAAGAEVEEYVPSGKLWRIHAFRINFTTDATVADRAVSLAIAGINGNIIRIPSSVVQTASTTRIYQFGVGLLNLENATSGIITVPLFPDLFLNPADIISTITTNRQATDNFGAPEMYVERLLRGTY